jgi:hypothetical protein
MAVTDPTRLGCGRLLDEVWDHADADPTAHEQSCPYCQRARASAHDLAAATTALTDHENETPDYTPGPHVKDFVMQLVNIEVRRGQPIPLTTPDPPDSPPDLTISEQGVLDVIWRAADAVPGLRARHCAVHLQPADPHPGQPGTIDITINITVAGTLAILSATDRLRTQLHEQVSAETGLVTRRINVTVEDLYDA